MVPPVVIRMKMVRYFLFSLLRHDPLIPSRCLDSEDDHDSPRTGKKASKRVTTTATTKASRRKSGGIALDAIVTKGDEELDAKALKRKNQNRAAQKAFRERREARVKDVSRLLNSWMGTDVDGVRRSSRTR